MDPKYSPYPEPALIFPEPGSYMPLYSAAQWIASRAFEVVPDEIDEEEWRTSYRSLLDALSAGKVRASGVRGGERSLISPHAFAACRIVHWWEGYQQDIAGGRELYLRCGVYANDEQWRGGNHDALTNVLDEGWMMVLVSGEDVATLWPPEKLQIGGGREVPPEDLAASGNGKPSVSEAASNI
jgi:hypothetical protein